MRATYAAVASGVVKRGSVGVEWGWCRVSRVLFMESSSSTIAACLERIREPSSTAGQTSMAGEGEKTKSLTLLTSQKLVCSQQVWLANQFAPDGGSGSRPCGQVLPETPVLQDQNQINV